MTDKASAALAVSTVGLVIGVYSSALPTLADARGQHDDRGHLAAGERYAALVSVAVVLGVAGACRAPEAAVAGVIAVIGLSAAYRNACDHTP